MLNHLKVANKKIENKINFLLFYKEVGFKNVIYFFMEKIYISNQLKNFCNPHRCRKMGNLYKTYV